MRIGLLDVDSHNFPNLALMKISAYHKAKGDQVEWCIPMLHYDIVYVSKVFGDEYSDYDYTAINADKIIYGGTGFAISVVDGKEVYEKTLDDNLQPEIEHAYPDYSLYPKLTKDTAYGFLTRGCPNNCAFCLVSKKEGRVSHKVADLSEFWSGQKNICLMDPNLLACKDHMDLLKQLAESGAKIDFMQGLDARYVTSENAKRIIRGLQIAKEVCGYDERNAIVYVLTNFDTTIQEDLYRVDKIQEHGYTPDIRIYRKNALPKRHILRDLQSWCNNRILYRSCSFEDYVPRSDLRTIREIYPKYFKESK